MDASKRSRPLMLGMGRRAEAADPWDDAGLEEDGPALSDWVLSAVSERVKRVGAQCISSRPPKRA